MDIILSSRSLHQELTRKAHSLFDGLEYITDRQELVNRKDWEYLYDVFFGTPGDFLISVDDDFFITNPPIIKKIIDYMVDHKLEIVGAPSSTTKSKIIDSWFYIADINRIQKYKPTAKELLRLKMQDIHDCFDVITTDAYYPGDKDEFFFLLMLEKGCRFGNFEKRGDSNEFLYAYGNEIGVHTRNGRDYDDPKIKKYIDEIYDFVIQKRVSRDAV